MAKDFKEKTITVNLRKVFEKPVTKRAISAKNLLKKAAEKETRIKEIYLSGKVNELIWSRGKYGAPRKITIKIVKEKERGIVLLPDEKYSPKQEKKKDDKDAQTKKTEEAKEVKQSTAKKEPAKENKPSKDKAPKAEAKN